jgi:ribosome-binding ATPase
MSLSIGIVGLPNVGKSTLFKALTNSAVDIQNYPFTTIDPSVGVVKVPDQRVDALTLFSSSKKKIYTTIDFVDIAGLVQGAAQGEGLGNKFLSNIRETDAIAQVVRAFPDPPGNAVTHVHNRISPANDIGIINTELVIADLETVTKRLDKTGKDARSGDKKAISDLVILNYFKPHLESGRIISKLDLDENQKNLAKELNLLTAKPFIYVINLSEDQLMEGYKPDEALTKALDSAPYVTMCNKMELSLSESTPDEKKEFLAEFNLPESGLDQLIKKGYETLGLLTFLTTGEDETRAWTAHIGDPIPRASRAIHTDFEKLFIRAEVINWKTLLDAGSHAVARSKGLIRVVGKDYIIEEGDVVEILIGK